jgi:hypothetical protein
MILNTLISLAFNHKISIDVGIDLQQWMKFRNTIQKKQKLSLTTWLGGIIYF